MDQSKKKLLIFYDWFYPGFMAGGPIQSLTNLCRALLAKFDIYVITGAFDLNADSPYPNIVANQWNKVCLSKGLKDIDVFYAGKNLPDRALLLQLFRDVNPSVIYLNGIFSYRFFLLPLLISRKFPAIKVVLCPRGMLKKGALSSKAFKKKLYLVYLKLSGICKKVYWHATTPEEAKDISYHFPVNRGIVVAANIPKMPVAHIKQIKKEPGNLKLVYLSLINEHKNLGLLLQTLQLVNMNIKLDIYGPIIDPLYWEKCREEMSKPNVQVDYKGLVEPNKVQDVIAQYHAFILLTKGENFGHAIFESLSVARPVITSKLTPWIDLHKKMAGVNVGIDDSSQIIPTLQFFVEMGQLEYDKFCEGAYREALAYYEGLNVDLQYEKLFSQQQMLQKG